MIRCVKCDQVDAIMKAGFVRGVQRFYCKSCDYYFSNPEEKRTALPKRKRPTTIIDIARELGVSNSTVSRALHGHTDINPNTRAQILKTAAEMDYQPNQLAYNLAKSRTNTIGLIAPEFRNSFFPNVIVGAHEVLTNAGYNLLIMQSNESYALEVSNTKAMLANRIDGLMVSLSHETNNWDHLSGLEKRGVPLVLFNRVSDEIAAPKVVVNDFEAAFTAIEHLIQNGYRRIAHLGGPLNLRISQDRVAGYRAALQKHGLETHPDWVIHGDLTPQKAQIYGKFLLERQDRPDAIFAVNDPTAIQLIVLARELGLNVPNDLGIVGFSDDPISAFIEPGLTTISQPTIEMGKTAANLILKILGSDSDIVHTPKIELATQLIIRKSSLREAYTKARQ